MKNKIIPWNKGKKCPEISERMKGHVVSEKSKIKMREAKKKNPTRYWLGKERPEMKGEKNWKYKNGKTMNNGYVRLGVSESRIYEHRKVMELHIGRKLKKCEHVHHIDGNKENNNINNLMLFPTNKAHQLYHASLKNFNN